MASRLPVTSGLYNFSRLAKNSSKYTKRMNRLSNQIFTEVVRPTDRSSMRVVGRFTDLPVDLNTSVVHYYDHARHPEADKLLALLRGYGLYRDEHADFREEIERLRELRGKGKNRFFERHRNKIKSQ